MRALCVGRHEYLSEHLCRFFEKLGVAAFPCVGVADAPKLMAQHDPDVVICDYDLLATTSLADWEQDRALSGVPVIAVSLTRHPGEAHLMDVNGIAGFLYLPTLVPEDAQRLLTAVTHKGRGITPPTVFPWPGSNPVAEIR
jgi:DNA-binding NarL/FixJ family response regulator